MGQTLGVTQDKDQGWGVTQKYWVFSMQEVQFLHTHMHTRTGGGGGGGLCSQ